MKWVVFAAIFVAMGAPRPAWSQGVGDPDHEWCNNRDRDEDRYCEVREFEVAATGNTIRVDAQPNGGISVTGWDRNQIRVTAKVQAWSRRGEDSESIAQGVMVRAEDGLIEAEGPRFDGRRNRAGWSVSYRIMVPNDSDLDLESMNGGISVEQINGQIRIATLNGGLNLEDVSGEVRGRTTNGGIDVVVGGSRWNGTSLDVQTTNGGVELTLPDGFQADLEVGTTNGTFRIDFPITVQGRIDRRHLRTELNGGGPMVRAITTNGSVVVRRR